MAFAPIAFVIPEYDRNLYSSWWLKAYEPGTTTPQSMATDSTGGTTAAKFQLNTEGFPITAGNALVVPHIDGDYDLWLFPTAAEADANDTTNALQFADNLGIISLIQSVSSASSEIVLSADTVADMKTKDLQSGQVIETQVNNTTSNAGGAKYLIQTAAEFGGTPDGYGDHTLANGNVAVLQKEKFVTITQYGAVSGQDSTVNIQAAFTANDFVYINAGEYLVTSALFYKTGQGIWGAGSLSVLKGSGVSFSTSDSVVLKAVDENVVNVLMRDFFIDGDNATDTGASIVNGIIARKENVVMDNLEIANTSSGIRISGSYTPTYQPSYEVKNCVVTNCLIHNVNEHGIVLEHHASKCSITNNRIYDLLNTGIGSLAINMSEGSYECSVIGNHIENTPFGMKTFSSRHKVIGNTINTTTAGYGINISDNPVNAGVWDDIEDGQRFYNIVQGNTIYNTFAIPVEITGDYVIFSGNQVFESKTNGTGAFVEVSGQYVNVTGNTITTSLSRTGVKILPDALHVKVSDNIINVGAIGIDITDTSRVYVENNLIIGGTKGIQTVALFRASITGNDIQDAAIGIEQTTGDYTQVCMDGNHIDNATTGIILRDSCNRLSLCNNNCSDSSSADLQIDDTDLISESVISSNTFDTTAISSGTAKNYWWGSGVTSYGNKEFVGSQLNSNSRNPLKLTDNFLWVDATGDLRISSTAPTSDTDGVVVGSQT